MFVEINNDLAAAIEQQMQLDESHQQVVRRLLLAGLKAQGRSATKPAPRAAHGRTRIVVEGTVQDLLRSGLVSDGDELRYAEARRRIVHTARIHSDGRIQTDKATRSSPSSALRDLVGYEINGWKCWIHVRSGKTLSALRDGLGS